MRSFHYLQGKLLALIFFLIFIIKQLQNHKPRAFGLLNFLSKTLLNQSIESNNPIHLIFI